jgi:hypothetical protein
MGGVAMVWQYILVGALIVLALTYLGRQLWRSTKGCAGGCGCSKKKSDAPVAQVTLIPEKELRIRRRTS